MKNFKSRLAIILAMMMVFTSFTFISVFAGDDPVDGASTVNEPASPVEESTKKDATETIGDVTGIAGYSSYESVVFLWDKVDGADGYIVNGDPLPADHPVFETYKDGNKEKIRYNKTGLGEGGYARVAVKAYKDVSGEDGTTRIESSKSALAGGYAVETIRYRVRIKKGGTLYSHGGSGPRSIYVSKGQYIDCYGFGGGKYIFNYGGSIFYCNKTRTNKRSCLYNPGRTYSVQEAEFFVNDRGLSSGTGKLVWINTYTQTMYMFSGSAKNWKCELVSKCSTGKAASPTPTGVYGFKTIWKKIGKRHGIKYWSPFSQINSIHSRKAKWGMGAPKSNGCVRNYIEAAQQVYYGAPIGTTVYVF